MEDQRISKLIAEIVFGICFVLAIICFIVAAIILTGTTNSTLVRYFPFGFILLFAGIGLAVFATSIKSIQYILETRRAKKEFEKNKK